MSGDPYALYDLVTGLATAGGLLYLAHRTRQFVAPSPPLVCALAGLLTFVVGGPVVGLLVPTYAHVVCGVAALLVAVGLYVPLGTELRSQRWPDLLDEGGRQLRPENDWMAPMDDDILELFYPTPLVLTPAVVAYNIGYSREQVNRRLSDLTDHGFVERVERGKYRITDAGARYIESPRARAETTG